MKLAGRILLLGCTLRAMLQLNIRHLGDGLFRYSASGKLLALFSHGSTKNLQNLQTKYNKSWLMLYIIGSAFAYTTGNLGKGGKQQCLYLIHPVLTSGFLLNTFQKVLPCSNLQLDAKQKKLILRDTTSSNMTTYSISQPK